MNVNRKLLQVLILLAALFFLDTWHPAYAIPSFARQTGYPCTACHTIYPQLTPLGRQFKLNGYTDGTQDLVKQISAWLQTSYTHTSKDQTSAPAPHFSTNDNLALDQASLFFGGKIADKVGAFLQGTYDGVGRQWTWDNMDVRFANQATLAGKALVYGLSLNNNPSVEDLWNTTPAWSYPFDSSAVARGPAAATLIEGGLGQIAAGGSAYAMWGQSVYLETGLYHTLSTGAIRSLGGDPGGTPSSDGVAPYWRFAYEKQFGASDLSVGTFGLTARLYPGRDQSMGSDRFTDVGIDARYQWTGARDNVTARFSVIHEKQNLPASFALGDAANPSNRLQSLNTSITYTYDQTLGFTASVGHLWGKADPALYGTTTGSPATTSLTFQVDWLPLNKKPIEWYPWFNPKFTAQFVHFTRLDGSTANTDGAGRNASDDDAIFLLTTFTF